MKIGEKYEDGHAPHDPPIAGHEITIFWESASPNAGGIGAFIAKKDGLVGQGRTPQEALLRLDHCMNTAYILDCYQHE